MADNTTLDSMSGGDVIATDDIAGVKYQRVKIGFGADGSFNEVTSTSTNPLPVTTPAPSTGATELAKAVDATSGGSDVGIANLVVRDDALTTLTPVDGDYVQQRCNSVGATWVAMNGTVTVDATGQGDVPVTLDGEAVTISGTVSVDLGANNDVTVTSGSITETNSAAILADTASMDTNLGTVAGAVSGTEMQVDVVASLPAGTNNIGDVDVASIAAGTNLVGDVGLSGARTSGGTSIFYSGGTTTLQSVKASAGQIYWIHCMNLSAAVAYLQVFNLTTGSVTLGTTAPTMEFALPTQGDTNGAGFTLAIPNGIAMGTAISVAITSDHEGSTTLTTDTAILNIGYA